MGGEVIQECGGGGERSSRSQAVGSGAEVYSYPRRVEASTVGCEKGWEMMSSDLEIMLWRSALHGGWLVGASGAGRGGAARGRVGGTAIGLRSQRWSGRQLRGDWQLGEQAVLG